MHEQDRVGVNIVVTGTAAGVGFAIGGPVGAVAGALVPEIVREITSKRVRDTEAVAERACDLAGFSGPELAEWVKASDWHAAFFMEAIEAAWAALDAHKLRTLGYVLADGMTDEPKLDIDQLVIPYAARDGGGTRESPGNDCRRRESRARRRFLAEGAPCRPTSRPIRGDRCDPRHPVRSGLYR